MMDSPRWSRLLALAALGGALCCTAVENLGDPPQCQQDHDCLDGRCSNGLCIYGPADASRPPAGPDAGHDAGNPDTGCHPMEGSVCAALCPDGPSGLYCDNDGMVSGEPGTLYRCPGPKLAPTYAVPCPKGCKVNSAGVNDECLGLTCPSAGAFCGNDGIGNGGDPKTLYQCVAKSQAPSSWKVCLNGCQVNTPGVDDTCK
jgi:hypothetical protein